MRRMVAAGTCSERRMGSISSEVDRYTAISVPTVMTRPAYRDEAPAEKPHWGNAPSRDPMTGPNRPDFRTRSVVRSLMCRSRNSMSR